MVSRTRAAILELEQLLEDKLDFHQVGSIRAVLGEAGGSELATMEACLDAAGVDGLVLAGGCCGSGVAASGGFGQVVADLVRGATSEIDISAYRPDRFGTVDPASHAFRQRCAAARSDKSCGRVDREEGR